MSITRDRELADVLYTSYNHLSQLKTDLDLLHTQAEQDKSHAVTHTDASHTPGQPATGSEATAHDKALADALKKVSLLHRNLETVIKLIIQNHTDASSILPEFEKIRTGKLLNSETFSLTHLINPPSK